MRQGVRKERRKRLWAVRLTVALILLLGLEVTIWVFLELEVENGIYNVSPAMNFGRIKIEVGHARRND